ncbi:MAG: hypothetical protein ACNA78_03005 [Balneolaceae bacterium]
MIKRSFVAGRFFFGFVLCWAWATSAVHAQVQSEQEVLLQFRHEGVVNTFLSTIFVGEEFYLSVNEYFDALLIDRQVDTGALTITGQYLDKGRYRLDFQQSVAQLQNREIPLTADDFVVSDLGFYLHPRILDELFGLRFNVDFGTLSVSLETDDTMPVVAQRERERRRARMMRTQGEIYRTFHPLLYDRERHRFTGGFLDYNLTGNVTDNSNSFIYNTSFGTELLGGDLQGTVFGNVSDNTSSLRTNNFRWRYGMRENPYLTSAVVGQTTAGGLLPVAYTGVRLSNEPLEPRFLFDQTTFSGTATPDAEVELYRNNSLIDFQRADAGGNYHFIVPLTYGTSNYSIRTFTPSGLVSEQEARIQIPFNFLPSGEVNYTIDAGRLDNPLSGSLDRGIVTKGFASAGINQWLTARAGVEYFEDFHDGLPTFAGGFSARFFQNYLLSFEAANDAFIRSSLNVIYPSSASFSINYTDFLTQGGLYNPGRLNSQLRSSIFTPFQIGSFPLLLRLTLNNDFRTANSTTSYRIDLNTRLSRANIRLAYRDRQSGSLAFETSPSARVNSSVTYTFSQAANTPALLRGIFLRGTLDYIPSLDRVESTEVQVSRRVMRDGRLQLSWGRNFLNNFNFLRFGFTFDFNRVRTNSSVRSTDNNFNASQTVRGSLGYDPNNDQVLASNRLQVGQAGVAVRMFVDNNNSGTYDEGDELLPYSAVRAERSGGRVTHKNGVSYITQLQAYRQFNLTVSKTSIPNPLLVPAVEQFSIVTDPNQYKLIDIPVYATGIIQGAVIINRNQREQGVGGLRLFLEEVDVPPGRTPITRELRTFSDGGFYEFELPPGTYQLIPDPTQMDFLNATPQPDTLRFAIESKPDGDFVENLRIRLSVETSDEESNNDEISGVANPKPVGITILAGLEQTATQFQASIDTVSLQQCAFPVQVSSFRGIDHSRQKADELQELLGIELHLFYNRNTDLFAGRTKPLGNLSEALLQKEQLQQRLPDNRFAIVGQCGSAVDYHDTTVRYMVPVWRTDTRVEAEELLHQSASNPFTLSIRQTNDHYIVGAGPFKSYADAVSAQTDLRSLMPDRLPGIIIDPERENRPEFRFQLYIGNSEDLSEIEQWAKRFTDQNNRSMVFKLEPTRNDVHLFDESVYRSWSQFLNHLESTVVPNNSDELTVIIFE